MSDDKIQNPEELKAENPVEPKPVEAAAEPKAAEQPVKPAEEKKEAIKIEKPASCITCSKSIKKKRWYYRDGKYYCSKRCWQAAVKKEKAPA
jgi:hypothetical protein